MTMQKIVLGTKIMNILFTSSIRLDNNECPIIGASSSNGFIPSRDTRIFVDKHKLQDIKSWYKEELHLTKLNCHINTNCIHSTNVPNCDRYDPNLIDHRFTCVTDSHPSIQMIFAPGL